MQVDKFFLSTLLSGYYLSTCIFHSNNSNWGHSTSMLHTSVLLYVHHMCTVSEEPKKGVYSMSATNNDTVRLGRIY